MRCMGVTRGDCEEGVGVALGGSVSCMEVGVGFTSPRSGEARIKSNRLHLAREGIVGLARSIERISVKSGLT